MVIVRPQHKYLWGLTGNHAPDSRQEACKMPVCPRVLLFLCAARQPGILYSP